MRRSLLARGSLLGLLGALAVPAVAAADTLDAAKAGALPDSVAINTLWVIVAGCLVMFMQAGFAFLEIGFSRGKNAGTVIAKILTNFSIAALAVLGGRIRLRLRRPGDVIGHDGFFLDATTATRRQRVPRDGPVQRDDRVEVVLPVRLLRRLAGDRLGHDARADQVRRLHHLRDRLRARSSTRSASHWVFGGGWLQVNLGMQDFAGSTAVHLIGATGALAVLLLLGPRQGKYGPDGKPRAIPGHNMPLFGLGVLILWLGWFGFNPGSTLNALDGRFAEILIVTQLAAAAGVLGALVDREAARRGRSTSAWRATARSPRSSRSRPRRATSSCGRRRSSARVAGVIVVARRLRDRQVASTTRSARCRPTAWPASGARSRAASSPRRALAEYNGSAMPGLVYTRLASTSSASRRCGVVVVLRVRVRRSPTSTFWAIKKTYGLRVTAEEEDAGLDISEHGMYGYPEQFIPAPELVGYGRPRPAGRVTAATPCTQPTQEVPAT